MKRILAAASAIAGLGLTGCASAPVPVGPTSIPTSETTIPAQESTSSPAASGASVKDVCETFNSLYAEYKAVTDNDPNAFEDIYLKSQDAKKTVTGDLRGLFASLSLLSIDHSTAAGNGGQPEQASKDAVRDAVFANAGTCTAEGVTLRL